MMLGPGVQHCMGRIHSMLGPGFLLGSLSPIQTSLKPTECESPCVPIPLNKLYACDPQRSACTEGGSLSNSESCKSFWQSWSPFPALSPPVRPATFLLEMGREPSPLSGGSLVSHVLFFCFSGGVETPPDRQP